MVCTLLGFALIVFFFYESTVWQAVFSSFLFYALVAVVDMLSMEFLRLLGLSPEAMMSVESTRAVFIINSNLFYTVFILLAVSFSKKSGKTFSLKSVIPFLPCEIISIVICCMILVQSVSSEPPLWMILYLAVLLYLNITILLYAERIQQSVYKEQQYELLEKQYSLQQDYYKKLHDSQEETQALWHDIKKYLFAMKDAASSDHSNEADLVIRQAQEALDGITQTVETGNTQINTILTYYLSLAKSRGIPVDMDISVPQYIPIPAVDLYVIIGNTFDNAIEACVSLPEGFRHIKLKLRMQNSMLLYSIENPYVEKKLHLQGKYHGYGLKNVQKCVEKYHGTMSVSHDTSFMCTIRLNCADSASMV